jgi:DnaJ-class molecular chaperone
MSDDLQTHYDTLSVPPNATADMLRAAYRRAAQRHHPDRCGGDAQAQQQMAHINAAYAVLSHAERRASYDAWMRARQARRLAEAAAQAARPSGFAATWPWGLIAGTTAFALGTVGTVLYKTSLPALVIATQALTGG